MGGIDIVLAGAGVSSFRPVVLLLAVAAEGFFINGIIVLSGGFRLR
jgi:hypothetical protein